MQLRLVGIDDDALPRETTPKKHRFFFAIRPNAQASDLALGTGRQLRAKHNLRGKLFATRAFARYPELFLHWCKGAERIA
jgi:hypothetical protein